MLGLFYLGDLMKERYFNRIQRDLIVYLRNKGPTTLRELEKRLGYGRGYLKIVIRKTPAIGFVEYQKRRIYYLKLDY